ncbi:hypothetical protein ES707_02769 [subsurface metagenome]
MADIALISCTKSKRGSPSPAALLYTSTLFNKSLLYAQTIAKRTYILSAKHGLLSLEDQIDPYELSIKSLSRPERELWAQKVGDRLRQLIRPRDTVHMLAGREYYNPLLEHLQQIRCNVSYPLQGKSLGSRVSWLKARNCEQALSETHADFYSALKRLYVGQDGGRLFSTCNGKLDWPVRGVYLIFEPDELLQTRKFRPLNQRVSRVGTHAVSKGSKATLWNRLSAHRGTSLGGGNHRASIFRLHLGAALIAKSPRKWDLPTWGVGQVAPAETQRKEMKLEEKVSEVIGKMRILWLNIPDEPGPQSDRAFIERNAIGTLSREYLVAGHRHSSWLGNFSPNINIPLSGLWNLNHLNEQPHEAFAEIFSTYVEATLGTIPLPAKSLAPVAWYSSERHTDSHQLSLFSDGPAETPHNPG